MQLYSLVLSLTAASVLLGAGAFHLAKPHMLQASLRRHDLIPRWLVAFVGPGLILTELTVGIVLGSAAFGGLTFRLGFVASLVAFFVYALLAGYAGALVWKASPWDCGCGPISGRANIWLIARNAVLAMFAPLGSLRSPTTDPFETWQWAIVGLSVVALSVGLWVTPTALDRPSPHHPSPNVRSTTYRSVLAEMSAIE